jgi:hypothetical protein
MTEPTNGRWLLLIHQLPPKPNYLRVKIWRRLQRLGAIAIKNSVYALPKDDQSQEDFRWVLREIIEGGGDGTLCEAHLIDGMTDDDVEALFHSARAAEYVQIAEAARLIAKTLPVKVKPAEADRLELEHEIVKLRRRLDEVVAIDFFGAPGREAANGLISEIELRSRGNKGRPSQTKIDREKLRRKIWVTRKGIHVDRIASAWLVRRFIDEDAKFKFVPAKGYKPLSNEIRFDMFKAEFTHEGDRCTFEILIERVGIEDSALIPIAEIIHDIDLKDGKFKRQEALGIERVIGGIAMSHKDDETRLSRGAAVFNDLYEYFKRKRG